ncbi:hypothetical protein RJD39_22485 (plasmid) [Vibrio scophthalmi]|uniref:hypothetical protein n=2 Tax=Vibrio scophthalmi TaxID=45658 RepID=UPI00080964DA|nr:hypothetical protein VSVS12_04431 [Vibrio scophthalmi]
MVRSPCQEIINGERVAQQNINITMKNQDIALQNIAYLKQWTRYNHMIAMAEYLMSVNAFTYQELSHHFQIKRRVATHRVSQLRAQGFKIEFLGKNRKEGSFYRLVDCEPCTPKAIPKRQANELSFVFQDLVFVTKSTPPKPNVPFLWKIALGIATEPDKVEKNKIALNNKVSPTLPRNDDETLELATDADFL